VTNTDPSASVVGTERLRLVTDSAAQKSLGAKSVVLVLASLLGLVLGVVLIVTGTSILGWILAGLGVAGVLIWWALAANARAASKMTGDDLIEIVIGDEGVLVQGGLPVRWSEMSEISYSWAGAPTFTGGIAAASANATAKALDGAGIDRSKKVITISLRDYDAVKARATTKARRMVLFAPMLGDAATVHVGLNGRSDDDMTAVLQLLANAAAANGISFTRKD
jgi:hypothetical protein